ncbi:MAG: hypothetical protein D6737_04490 [Chloroflexi bacterium]|nr:MAG: hypothetical protein D6737_04490 [Chloroflexota bacterium]
MTDNPEKKLHGTKSGLIRRVDGKFVIEQERPQSLPEFDDAESSTGQAHVKAEGEDIAKQNDDSAVDSQADVDVS